MKWENEIWKWEIESLLSRSVAGFRLVKSVLKCLKLDVLVYIIYIMTTSKLLV